MSSAMPEEDRERGLYQKYEVTRLNDPEGKHDECRYLVLDPQHDLLAYYALGAYAYQASLHGYPALSEDIQKWLDSVKMPSLPPGPCPACDGKGTFEMADAKGKTTTYTCGACAGRGQR